MIGAATLTALTAARHGRKRHHRHFGSPTPMQVARAEKQFDAATGWTIEWRSSAGTEVIAAMASGDVQVAELGSSPLPLAQAKGVELPAVHDRPRASAPPKA
jgi:taurine transport system substrate-binding protein